MKEMWETPRIAVQTFVPGEYALKACYDYKVQLQCARPGRSQNYIEDGTWGSNNNDWHGSCGNWSEEFDVYGSGGYEVRNGVVNTLRPISNIEIGGFVGTNVQDWSQVYIDKNNLGSSDDLTTGYYKASWKSNDFEDGDGTIDYIHWGIAWIKEILQISNRPNHS